ncbi:MAG: two-component system, OmpR family, response regulator [Chloroflexota bacterium]|nr:two-component system, OmpR family, response regulator [Chloroflexota bacterium]
MRILVVEDEEPVAEGLRRALTAEGYAVDAVRDGDEALAWADTYPYDMILLDVVLPGRDGFSVCSALRERGSQAAILMLTALDQVEDRVTGLDRGADDYLAKPFAVAEVLARVRALRRRHADRRPQIHVGDVEIDPAHLTVRRAGREVPVTAREFALLEVLAREPGRIFSQDQLIDAVWDADFEGVSNIVEVYVRSLRRKLDDGRRDGLIQTVRGAGYRFAAPKPKR